MERRGRWDDDDEEEETSREARTPPAGGLTYRRSSDVQPTTVERPTKKQGPGRGSGLLDGCRSVSNFERLDRIEEGSYGVVYRAREKSTAETVALKRVKLTRDSTAEGFPVTALREINVLLALRHECIVAVREMVVGPEGQFFMVMDYYDHDLKTCLEKQDGPFSQGDVKSLMAQLTRAVAYMHSNWFMHRDIKTSNILYRRGHVALADFGLARKFGDPPPDDPPYTRNVVTLWYRAPELLLGARDYSGPDLDVWSVGCVFAELLARASLFNAKTEIEQLAQIFRVKGPPDQDNWPGVADLPLAGTFKFKPNSHFKRVTLRERFPPTGFGGKTTPLSDHGLHLLDSCLTLDPSKRISATDALKFPYFSEQPPPTPPHAMPVFQLDRF